MALDKTTWTIMNQQVTKYSNLMQIEYGSRMDQLQSTDIPGINPVSQGICFSDDSVVIFIDSSY